ncbi:hypothetical protein L1987_18991 [Smallanthus sonchifolius]|uniref:Uncharacterized protein n=1 Tax=Smallanthus sonchifolius TaxID=185202 RepID=A0ACB9J3C0_9ASTR|nr:hypothetical protein L1987_18991 [Smallanthus sonchifolius]
MLLNPLQMLRSVCKHSPIRRHRGNLLKKGASGFHRKRLAPNEDNETNREVDWSSFNELCASSTNKTSFVEEIDDIEGNLNDHFVADAIVTERELYKSDDNKKFRKHTFEEQELRSRRNRKNPQPISCSPLMFREESKYSNTITVFSLPTDEPPEEDEYDLLDDWYEGAVSNVPSHVLCPFLLGSRISAAYLPHGRLRTPRCFKSIVNAKLAFDLSTFMHVER